MKFEKQSIVSSSIKLVVILLIALNVAYWALSEVYIHNGDMLDGVIYGVTASSLSLVFGAVISYAVKACRVK